MPQWKSAVSLGEIVERFNLSVMTLPELVLAIQEEFRKSPYCEHSDVRHAAEALADMHLPAMTRDEGLRDDNRLGNLGMSIPGECGTYRKPKYARISTSATTMPIPEECVAYRKVLGELELRLQRLEKICAKDNRIYVSRVLRHFERGE